MKGVLIDIIRNDLDRNSIQHKDIYDRLSNLEQLRAVQATEFNQIKTMLVDVQKDIKDIINKPSQKWDALTIAITNVIATVIITTILNVIFKSM